MKRKSVKIEIPEVVFETVKEAAECEKMSVSEYINYLLYKENYVHLSITEQHMEKPFIKFYDRLNREIAEKNMWTTLFNLPV